MASFKIPKKLHRQLSEHRRAAIRFALPYLRGSASSRVGLIRMPTGTGKTGVIAVLSVALPPESWTLVLTPWKNLCKQMIDDLSERFWISRDWLPPSKPEVERLYPSTLADIVKRTDKNLIVVATFATLVTIFKKYRKQYDALAGNLSQVFVDEGHYEPAVEWGQAVKQMKRPTVLLTATPYRKDLKLFRVAKHDVFNFTHKRAVEKKIIRKVEFKSIGERD